MTSPALDPHFYNVAAISGDYQYGLSFSRFNRYPSYNIDNATAGWSAFKELISTLDSPTMVLTNSGQVTLGDPNSTPADVLFTDTDTLVNIEAQLVSAGTISAS